MANSVMQLVSDGSLSTIPLTIKFFEQAHIKVSVDGALLPANGYSYVWSGATTITISPAVSLGIAVEIRRQTPADSVLHDFQAGAVFSEVSVDENFRQDLFLLQEAREQSVITDLFSDLDMHGNVIRNLKPAVAPTDAVNLAQVQVITEGGTGYLLRQDLAQPTGAALIGYGQSTVAAVIASILANGPALTPYTPAGSGLDDTANINTILTTNGGIYLRSGVYNIDPDVGILLDSSYRIAGAGFMRTLLLAKEVGATVSELASYTKGSLIKRTFVAGIANAYVSGVHLDGFSVIMRHPATISVGNYRQIGIDLRNCDRAYLGSDLYVGNTTLPGMPYTWQPVRASQAQGYGIVIGTRSSNSIDYCGGVGCIVDGTKVYGARKNIAVDELQLSPDSAAHATIINNPDVQIGVELITASSRYNAGSQFNNCLIQSMQRFTAGDTTIGLSVAGYNCAASIRYLEGGPNCDYAARLDATSKDCTLDVLYSSVTGASAGTIYDAGTNNSVTYKEFVVVPGVSTTTSGRQVSLFNRGYVGRKVKVTTSGSIGAMVTSGDSGVLVERVGAANYKITLDKAYVGPWGINISAKTNASRYGFSFDYYAQTTNSVNIDTYVNNVLLDPLEMVISVFGI